MSPTQIGVYTGTNVYVCDIVCDIVCVCVCVLCYGRIGHFHASYSVHGVIMRPICVHDVTSGCCIATA